MGLPCRPLWKGGISSERGNTRGGVNTEHAEAFDVSCTGTGSVGSNETGESALTLVEEEERAFLLERSWLVR